MHFLKKMSIKTQLLILAATTIAIVLILIFMTYFMISKVIAKNNSEYTKDIASQIKQSISSNYNSYYRILNNITFNSIVQSYLAETDDVKSFQDFLEVNKLLNNMQDLKDGILDIALLSKNGNHFYLNGKKVILEETINQLPPSNELYCSPMLKIEYGRKMHSCFILISPVFMMSGQTVLFGNRVGQAAIVIDAANLGLDETSLSTSTTQFYLLDRSGVVYSSSNPSTFGKAEEDILEKHFKGGSTRFNTVINGREYTVNIDYLPQTDGRMMSVVPQEELYSDLSKIRQLVIVLFLSALAVLSVPFVIITNNILYPLHKFTDFMSTVRSGSRKGLQKRIMLEGYMEIGAMANEFNTMLDEIDSLTGKLIETGSKLYKSELEKKQSELAFLQSQINPHFIYNTLESMKGIAAVKGVMEIRKMASNLGLILRYSVKGEEVVAFAEELNIAKAYIEIQQIRFIDRIDVIYQFTEDVFPCKIIKMVLQPVIENAIYHGLEPKMEQGHLWIGGETTTENELLLWVRDDGVGMESSTLAGLLTHLAQGESGGYYEENGRSSIGILNVNSRIQLTYGSQYGISIHSEPGKGTEVIYRLPQVR